MTQTPMNTPDSEQMLKALTAYGKAFPLQGEAFLNYRQSELGMCYLAGFFGLSHEQLKVAIAKGVYGLA